jgi:hypothetical protein
METEFLVRKQAFLRWLTELPEVKKAKFEEEYDLSKAQKEATPPAKEPKE